MAETMKIVIDDAGNVTVDLDGFVGEGCHAVQEAMGEALGVTTKIVKKPEFYKKATNTTKRTIAQKG